MWLLSEKCQVSGFIVSLYTLDTRQNVTRLSAFSKREKIISKLKQQVVTKKPESQQIHFTNSSPFIV